MEKLKVFAELPKDERNTKIDETFVPMATPAVPQNAEQWAAQRQQWMTQLRGKCFNGWPVSEISPTDNREGRAGEGIRFRSYYAYAENVFKVRTLLICRAGLNLKDVDHIILHVMDEAGRCDHLLLMREGRLLADLTPDELSERTDEHDMEQAFLRLIEREEAFA